MLAEKLVMRGLQHYWRLSRGLSAAAEACIVDSKGQILLVRHGDGSNWSLPGGPLKKGETFEAALARHVGAETGFEIAGRPQLFGVASGTPAPAGVHIALYLVRAWRAHAIAAGNRTTPEQQFFAATELPAAINPAAKARLAGVLADRTLAQL